MDRVLPEFTSSALEATESSPGSHGERPSRPNHQWQKIAQIYASLDHTGRVSTRGSVIKRLATPHSDGSSVWIELHMIFTGKLSKT
jgi:hypothetical protein